MDLLATGTGWTNVKLNSLFKEVNKLEYQYKSTEELPPFLNASQVAAYLGLSLSNIYTLMHSQGFPTLVVGKRKIVEKKKLLQWIEENTAK